MFALLLLPLLVARRVIRWQQRRVECRAHTKKKSLYENFFGSEHFHNLLQYLLRLKSTRWIHCHGWWTWGSNVCALLRHRQASETMRNNLFKGNCCLFAAPIKFKLTSEILWHRTSEAVSRGCRGGLYGDRKHINERSIMIYTLAAEPCRAARQSEWYEEAEKGICACLSAWRFRLVMNLSSFNESKRAREKTEAMSINSPRDNSLSRHRRASVQCISHAWPSALQPKIGWRKKPF